MPWLAPTDWPFSSPPGKALSTTASSASSSTVVHWPSTARRIEQSDVTGAIKALAGIRIDRDISNLAERHRFVQPDPERGDSIHCPVRHGITASDDLEQQVHQDRDWRRRQREHIGNFNSPDSHRHAFIQAVEEFAHCRAGDGWIHFFND